MAEKTQTKDRINETYERTETFMNAVFDSNRQVFFGMLDFQRRNMDSSLHLARMMQEEGLRFTDQWMDQVNRMQKNTMKSFQDYSSRFQDSAEKIVREQQERLEQTLERNFEMAGNTATNGSSKTR